MDAPDTPEPEDRPDPTKMEPGYGHLLQRDTRTPEEKLAASIKEHNRRTGKGRGKWWDKEGS